MWRPSITGALVALLATGCASAPFPDDRLRGVDRSLTLGALRAAPLAHRGARVILGGQVIATVPKPGATEIEVLSRRLRGNGVPESGDRSDGRFLVRTAKFLDPAIYAPGRRLTILGTVRGTEERPIGSVPYTYIVVEAEHIKLWPKAEAWVGNPSYPPLPLDAPVLPYPPR
jgi:outer membrane lipoprotein